MSIADTLVYLLAKILMDYHLKEPRYSHLKFVWRNAPILKTKIQFSLTSYIWWCWFQRVKIELFPSNWCDSPKIRPFWTNGPNRTNGPKSDHNGSHAWKLGIFLLWVSFWQNLSLYRVFFGGGMCKNNWWHWERCDSLILSKVISLQLFIWFLPQTLSVAVSAVKLRVRIKMRKSELW